MRYSPDMFAAPIDSRSAAASMEILRLFVAASLLAAVIAVQVAASITLS